MLFRVIFRQMHEIIFPNINEQKTLTDWFEGSEKSTLKNFHWFFWSIPFGYLNEDITRNWTKSLYIWFTVSV